MGCSWDNSSKIKNLTALDIKQCRCIRGVVATEVHPIPYLDFNSARLALFQYIEGWHNRKRIHSSIDYRTLQEMEDLALRSAA